MFFNIRNFNMVFRSAAASAAPPAEADAVPDAAPHHAGAAREAAAEK
jgi:hypothetical protein